MNRCAVVGQAVLVIFFASSVANAGEVAIVNPKNPVGALSKDELADIYLGNAKNFPGGSSAVPLDLPESASARLDFHKAITGKNETQFKAYWAKMVFSGRGVPPKEVPSDAEIKSMVAGNPNMIGYIDKSAVDSSVKVVFTAE
jgi:ABC-type phosphate transport system substrate-binding protein